MSVPHENWRTRATFDCLSGIDFVVPKAARRFFPRDGVLLISPVIAETEGDRRIVLFKPDEQLEIIALETTKPRFAEDATNVAVFVGGVCHRYGTRLRVRGSSIGMPGSRSKARERVEGKVILTSD